MHATIVVLVRPIIQDLLIQLSLLLLRVYVCHHDHQFIFFFYQTATISDVVVLTGAHRLATAQALEIFDLARGNPKSGDISFPVGPPDQDEAILLIRDEDVQELIAHCFGMCRVSRRVRIGAPIDRFLRYGGKRALGGEYGDSVDRP